MLERIERLVAVPPEGSNVVVITRLEHKVDCSPNAAGSSAGVSVAPASADNSAAPAVVEGGKSVPEIVLVGDQPNQQGHPGPVKRLASPYRGVSFHSCTQRWRSRIKHGTKSEHLGYFCSDVEAAHAYNEAAKKIHGPNALLNEGVDVVVANAPGLRSTVVANSTSVPYDGVTFYVDRDSKPRITERQRTGSSPPAVIPTPHKMHPSGKPAVMKRELKPKVFMPLMKKEVSLMAPSKVAMREPMAFPGQTQAPMEDSLGTCGSRLDFGPSFDQWDDLFLQYWFDDNSQPAFGYSDDFDSRCLKRSRSFTNVEPMKRIRC